MRSALASHLNPRPARIATLPSRTVSASGPPKLAKSDPAAGPRRTPVTEIFLGLALVATAGALILNRLGADLPLDAIIPAIVALAGTGLYLRRSMPHLLMIGLVRLLGAAATVVGVAVAVDGIRTL